ncbi:hypothetical protein HDE69_002481 [Pedobacter cryoconitis]|uniref:DUF2931 family protein n=1 Tax=Pedobacter cryoconitis TaxID=188932 RepID=A0A7W8YTV3_9SPHI|nr:DUF2931 family protein [Pedobacter cryoconitis]MBB5621420.1 hypothetical protein [Pedobacter cryoconitis]
MQAKYDWIPTECAPAEYPVQIYSGTFYYGDKGNIYIPGDKTVANGWGNDGSTHIAGDELKEVPHTLDLSWTSFVENKDYAGKFELNTKLIDSLFKLGFTSENSPGGHSNYHYVKVGMAPGGVVVVWLSGSDKQVEVGRYQAKKTKALDWKSVMPNMKGTMDDFTKQIQEDLPDKIKEQIKDHTIPFGKWDHWRKKFNWKPVITSDASINSLSLFTVNQEMEMMTVKELKAVKYEERSAVEKLYIFWVDDKQREMRSQLDFDEAETDKIFSALKPDEKAELILHVNNTGDVTAKLKTERGEAIFKAVKSTSYLR